MDIVTEAMKEKNAEDDNNENVNEEVEKRNAAQNYQDEVPIKKEKM